MKRSWRCPEDGQLIESFLDEPEDVERAVRMHFEAVPHREIRLAGFTVNGPVIQR